MNQRSRVHEMLRELRSTHSKTNSDDTLSDSSIPKVFSRASRYPTNMVGGGGSKSYNSWAASDHNVSGSQSDSVQIVVWVASVIALTALFLIIGQWVDVQLLDDDRNTPTYQQVGTDYSTVVLKTCFQIIFNVAILVVPFLIVRSYAKESLLCRYYFLFVFPLWVLSLHAQVHLRERLRILLQGEADPDDATKLTRLVSEAKRLEQFETPKQNKTHTQQPKSSTRMGADHRGGGRSVRAQRLQPNSRGVAVDNAPWESFEQEAQQTVQFTSPLLDHTSNPTESSEHSAPRHTDLTELFNGAT